MRINNLIITNFRGFEYKDIPLNNKFTVVVGENASGKTTLLKAVEIALGEYLQCLPLPKGERIHKRQFSNSDRFVKWHKDLKDYTANEKNTRVDAAGEFLNQPIKWAREFKGETTTHNKALAGRLIDAVDNLLKVRSGKGNVIMPIVATYGIERAVVQLRKGKLKSKRRSRLEKAFLGALKDTVDFEGVIDWLHDYDNELKYEREFEGTKDAIFEAIQTAIPYLDDVNYNNRYQQIEAFVKVEEHSYGKNLQSNMSDGFKAMLNVAAELAYRCVVLNGFLGKDAVKKTPGIVMIDELDMHLHPNWQKHVVKNLKDAFPEIQFIATTHSPFIIQSLKKEELLILDREEIRPEDDPDKKGIEDIAEDEMNVEDVQRSENFLEMEKVAAKYFDLIKEGKTSESDNEVNELRKQLNKFEEIYSDDPAFVALLKSERKANGL